MTAAERQDALVEEYRWIEDARERFQSIVDSAPGGPVLEEGERTDGNLVPGCVSWVWLVVRREADATYRVGIESESPALAGIAVLFRRIYDGATREEILVTEPDFIERLGIDRFLTPTRLRGLRRLRALLVERCGETR